MNQLIAFQYANMPAFTGIVQLRMFAVAMKDILNDTTKQTCKFQKFRDCELFDESNTLDELSFPE